MGGEIVIRGKFILKFNEIFSLRQRIRPLQGVQQGGRVFLGVFQGAAAVIHAGFHGAI
jgi:hypothetical protein